MNNAYTEDTRAAKPSAFRRFLDIIGIQHQDQPEYFGNEDMRFDNQGNPVASQSNLANSQPQSADFRRPGSDARDNRVIDMNTRTDMHRHEEVVYNFRSYSDSTKAIEELVKGKTVLLNLETLDDPSVRRAVDIMQGAAIALNAEHRRVGHRIYLFAPSHVRLVDRGQVTKVNREETDSLIKRY